MTTGRRVVHRVYSALIRLYPADFYTEFHHEMQATFQEALTAAGTASKRSLARMCMRELRDLPVGLLREQRRARRAERLEITTVSAGAGNHRVPGNPPASGRWQEALWAGLPHLLLALFIGLTSLTPVGDQFSSDLQPLAPVITAVAALSVLTVLLVVQFRAWREGWPLWSASWCLYVAVPILVLPMGFLQRAPFARAERLDSAFIYIVVPLALGFLFYRLIRRDRFMGLLAVLPLVALLWTPVLEFVPTPLRDWLIVAAWLLVGLTAIACVRLANAGTAIWLALGMNLLIGLPYACAQTYLKVLPDGAPVWQTDPPAVVDFVHTFAPPFLSLATLILGPALIWRLRDIGRQGGRRGVRRYRLAAVGFTLMVIGNLAAYWTMLRDWLSGDYLVFQVLVYGGLGLYLCASLALLAAAPHRKRLTTVAPCALLVWVLLGLPLVLMLPLLLGMRAMPRRMPFAFLHMHDARLTVYGLGFVWLLLAGWLASRRAQPTLRGPKLPLGLLAAALAGVLPVAAFSLYPVLHEYLGWPWRTPFLLSYGLLLVGIAVAWFTGFPHWSSPYVGLILMMSWANGWTLKRWVGARLEGIGLAADAGNVPGWLAWLPLLFLLALLLLISRSARPVGQLFRGIRQDWTRLSFALYSSMAWFLPAITDENHNPYLTVGLAIVAVALIWGAFGYMLQATRQQRVLALLGGLTIAWLATDVINATYWIGRLEPWMREPIDGRTYPLNLMAGWAVLMGILLLPGLPGRMRRSISALRTA